MGGLCEVLVETRQQEVFNQIFSTVFSEAKRLEAKYSRYLSSNVVFRINHSSGRAVKIDNETYLLLKFADSLFYASHGLFDLTSGVLRKIWVFDGSGRVPSETDVKALLKKIGWSKVEFNKSRIQLPEGFELDFGGIVKEYAVDSCVALVRKLQTAPSLINFGGDLAVTSEKTDGSAWKIDIDQSDEKLALYQGAVATSGDKHRFLMHQGRRLPHILNPKTGWPIEGAPRSVTILANNCVEAGALSTLSLLRGKQCEAFLSEEAEQYKIVF